MQTPVRVVNWSVLQVLYQLANKEEKYAVLVRLRNWRKVDQLSLRYRRYREQWRLATWR